MKGRLRVLVLSSSIIAAFTAALILAGVFLLDAASLSPGRLSLSDIRFGLGREQRLERLTLLFYPTRLVGDRSSDNVKSRQVQ